MMSQLGGVYCINVSDIPTCKHWVIVLFDTIHIPGDQRSIQSPGHGYPAHSEITLKYVAFKDHESWKGAIEYLTVEKQKFRAFEAHPAIITSTLIISVAS